MREKLVLFGFAALMAVSVSNVRAQWVSCGPQGGSVYTFAAMGPDIFVSTSAGVFRSTDSGSSWRAASSGISDTAVTTMMAAGNSLYAATTAGHIVRTTDRGAHWTDVSGITKGIRIYHFAVIDASVFASNDSIIFRTTDDGGHWTLLHALPDSSPVDAIAAVGEDLYCASWVGDLFRSRDNGLTWQRVDTNVRGFFAIGSHLFKQVDTINYGIHLLVSLDSGRSWNENGHPPISGCAIALGIQKAGDVLYQTGSQGDAFFSVDEGLSWIDMGFDRLSTMGAIGNILLIGESSELPNRPPQSPYEFPYIGILRSNDVGQSWLQANTGIYMFTTRAPAESQLIGMGNVIIGASYHGVFRSTDAGDHWTRTETGLPIGVSIRAFTSTGSKLFIATDRSGVFLSSDSGRTWLPLDTVVTKRWFPTSIAAVGSNLFVGVQNYDSTLVWRSSDNGMSWLPASTGLMHNNSGTESNYVISLASKDGKIFAGTSYGGSVFESTDLGASWTLIAPNMEVNSFTSNGAFLYASGSTGVSRSPDNGLDWHFAPIPGLTPNVGSVNSIQVIGSRLFAGTRDGIFLSTDSDLTWRPESQGLLDSETYSFATDGKFVFASTGSEVWRRQLSDLPAGSPASVLRPDLQQSDLSLSPNPTSGFVTISVKSNVSHVTITDLLGTSLFEFSNLSSGNFTLDLSKLPAGTYFGRFAIGGEIVTRKIVKE